MIERMDKPAGVLLELPSRFSELSIYAQSVLSLTSL